MSNETTPEPVSSPPSHGQRYFDRYSDDDPEYLRIRNMAADLRQDFNVMEQKKRVTMILQSPSFREELESLIQEQMKKGNNSSNIWALRQIADFMACTAPSVFPACPVNSSMVIPINDMHCSEPIPLAKGERLMRCKLASVYRLLDLYGWAQLSGTFASIRVNKEQDHFLISPRGIGCSEVTASSLVKVNILGEMVETGSTNFEVDTYDFSLHSAIYSARPDVRCIIQLHTAATTAVSAMKCGLLPISHDALLAGEVVYFEYNGSMEEEKDRIELQKRLGPTCKILVLRNHGVVALGESVEEAFYKIFHLQEACEIQVSAVPSAGGPDNLILLDREKYRPHEVGTVGWAGSMFGPMQKSRLGEHEFEALMRMMDNLGYRTGYAYRHPFVQEKTRHKSDVEIPATVTAFVFDEEGVPLSTLRQHAQKQQKEKTRWLNTPNTYLRVNVGEENVGSPRSKTTWLKADEVVKPSSGMPIRIENPNQFVPLFTDPREVLETRNKSAESNLASKTEIDSKEQPQEETPVEPEPPNPFSQLTDQELEEYKKEVERKKMAPDDLGDKEATIEDSQPSLVTPPTSPARSPTKTTGVFVSPSKSSEGVETKEDIQTATDLETAEEKVLPSVVLNGKEEDQSRPEETPAKVTDTETPKGKNEPPPSASPEGSPTKSPSKKKKKFRTPSFLKKGKKKEKEKAES
ncbi:beta-adducin isoform X1 [Pelobates cultripes]|uniref:Beta-adducin isoform X1 n=1 Tax=Pelobates cultripes TaxID=61616 RepID=A0AAD1RPW5_PELCU|nr:beta-adducin isoform X1 [Pelobates cultripes]